MTVTHSSKDLGDVAVGDFVVGEFEIQNNTKEVLVLRPSNKSCVCVLVKGTLEIPPFATGIYPLGIQVEHEGVYEATVQLTLEGENSTGLSLALRADGVNEWIARPSSVQITLPSARDSDAHGSINLSVLESYRDFLRIDVASNESWLTCRYHPKQSVISYTVLTNLAPAIGTAVLVIRSNSESKPIQEILITVTSKSKLVESNSKTVGEEE